MVNKMEYNRRKDLTELRQMNKTDLILYIHERETYFSVLSQTIRDLSEFLNRLEKLGLSKPFNDLKIRCKEIHNFKYFPSLKE